MDREQATLHAVSGTFAAKPAFSTGATHLHPAKRRTPGRTISCSTDTPPSSTGCVTSAHTRRAFLRHVGAVCGLPAGAGLLRRAAASDALAAAANALGEMRTRANDIDSLITAGKWDAVRTVLATAPLTGAKEACAQAMQSVPTDAAGAVAGLREDLLSAIRLLDTAVYANVFIGEDRQILGTKVDYDTPRVYLADLKDSLDALIDVVKS